MNQTQDEPDAAEAVEGGENGAANGADEQATGAGAASADELEIAATVEAILFATDSPISPAKIVQLGALPGRREVKRAIAALNERYEQMGCTFRIESIAGGHQMQTIPEYHDVVARLRRDKGDTRLSQAAMETLSIVAYRQPVLRANIEAIRGVACGEVLRGLLEKRLVKIVGRAEVLGRPMLYGTTKRFLEVFGLNSLKDLPNVAELRSGATDGDDGATPSEAEPDSDQAAEADDSVNAAGEPD